MGHIVDSTGCSIQEGHGVGSKVQKEGQVPFPSRVSKDEALQDAEINQVLSCLYLQHKEGSPSDTMADPKNKVIMGRLLKSECWRAKAPVGDPDLDRRWTQDNFKVKFVKLGETRKLLASHQLVQRSQSIPSFGPQNQLRVL
uniref:Uncharacterized protein n=1 Tax=Solanum tuberosum TaxID=4113 RepID=M1DLI8_SOLTU